MLDRLEQAFAEREASEDRLRRFLADASHELRTPLASIRGYAELLRIGAARDARRRPSARCGRIEDEAARMGVLVEDLLTLARLDEVRESRTRAVDLAPLARDAVDDARVTAPDRAIALAGDGPAAVLGRPPPAPPGAGQPAAQRARAHAGGHADRGLARPPTNGDVRLEVRDHGPGLPTANADELFERFWRAEGGRERGSAAAPGSAWRSSPASSTRHGGRVDAANAPDGGASFVVHLPAA